MYMYIARERMLMHLPKTLEFVTTINSDQEKCKKRNFNQERKNCIVPTGCAPGEAKN